MLQNGKPHTVENGWVDDKLLTDYSDEEIKRVNEWIAKNIRKSRSILEGHTSYGMKHILKSDTGIYLTNNAFKDALLMAGYKPVNANELNWRYRIVLVKELNENPGKFFNWAKQFRDDESPEGDFARDMERDFEFPVFDEHDVIKRYLHRVCACDDAMKAFESLWRLYARENH